VQSKKESINCSCLQTKVMVKQQQDTASCTISVIYNPKAQDADCVLHSIAYCCILYCTNSVQYLSNHMTTWWDSQNWQHRHIIADFKIHNAMCEFSTISASKALKVSRLLYPTCKTTYKSPLCLGPMQSPSAPHTTWRAWILWQSNALSDSLEFPKCRQVHR